MIPYALFGIAVHLWKDLITSVKAMFEGDFGGHVAAFRLKNVGNYYNGELVFNDGEFLLEPAFAEWSDKNASTIERVTAIRINFLTPYEILQNDKLVAEPDFSLFTEALFSRIAAVADLYGESEFVLPYRLMYRKPFVQVKHNLKIVTLTQKKESVTGVYGSIDFIGEITRYVPYIDIGTQLHIGKKTTRGCGEYNFEILR
ncbi:hypothetical protein FACS1894105_00440 [Clostridia bacterium]|nr:hypothetical protein FACS1894105_00440 [Clostridia bacterium]